MLRRLQMRKRTDQEKEEAVLTYWTGKLSVGTGSSWIKKELKEWLI